MPSSSSSSSSAAEKGLILLLFVATAQFIPRALCVESPKIADQHHEHIGSSTGGGDGPQNASADQSPSVIDETVIGGGPMADDGSMIDGSVMDGMVIDGGKMVVDGSMIDRSVINPSSSLAPDDQDVANHALPQFGTTATEHQQSADDDLSEAYEFLIKDWDMVEPEIGKITTEESDLLHVADKSGKEIITETGTDAVKTDGNEHAMKYAQNAKLIARLNSNSTAQSLNSAGGQPSQKAEKSAEKAAKKYGKSPTNFLANLTSSVADKFKPIKLSRANSKAKAAAAAAETAQQIKKTKSESDDDKNENNNDGMAQEKHENETDDSPTSSRTDSFAFDTDHMLSSSHVASDDHKQKHHAVDAQHGNDEASSSSSSGTVGDVFANFERRRAPSLSHLQRSMPVESIFDRGSTKIGGEWNAKNEKERLVDTLDAALAKQIVRQKHHPFYITEWKCASKYWTKYVTHFFWRNEQVALCKAWARVDAKLSELLEAWRPINAHKLPLGFLTTFLLSDKLEVEIGDEHERNVVDINEAFDHLRTAHQCIFEGITAAAAEGGEDGRNANRKCQSAKILNAPEWDKQIRHLRSEAKKLTATADKVPGTFPQGHVCMIKN